MKKIFLSFALMFLLLTSAMGQLKHVKGVSNIGVTGGFCGNSNIFGVCFSHYLQPSWIWNVDGLYETGKVESTRLKHYLINSGMDHTLFESSEFLYFNVGISLFSGFEKLISEETTVEDVTNYVFGTAGNFNIEFYINSKILFKLKAEQYYSPLSNLGKWFPVFSLSLKYCIF